MGALNWNTDITKHNQRLFMREQANNRTESPPQAGQLAGKATMPPFPLVSADKLTASPVKIHWLLENILERGSLNLLFGEPGAGKSLFALDWAFCMAAGLDWHGCRTKQTDVAIVAGEGFAGLARRLKALEAKYQQTAPKRLFISERPADFLDGQNIGWVADSIKALCPTPGLVIIDTLHRNMTGDENSSQDIAAFIGNIDRHIKPLGAAALIVHHSGHGQKDRSRGSSSIRAAMDGEFSATKTTGGITLTCHKAKDFEALQPLAFSLKPINLDGWQDDDGEPLTSVYLEAGGDAETTGGRRKLSARDDAILTSLVGAIAAHGIEPTADIKAKFAGFDSFAGKLRKVVAIEDWRPIAYKSVVTDSDSEGAKQKALKRCREKLVNQGVIVEYDDYAWPIYTD